MEDLRDKPWWNYLDKVQRDLIKQSLYLAEEEEKTPRALSDYSFVVFPAAKAYEGFLKKLFFDLELISRTQFSGERFRIGRALNPAIYKEYPQESVYEKLTRFCGGEDISLKLWKTWKNSRNLVFHFFPEKENLISFPDAKNRVREILEAIEFSFKGCHVPSLKKSFKNNILKNSLIMYFWVLIIWFIYRLFFNNPAGVEEGVIKPLLWLLPTLMMIKFVEKRPVLPSLGFSGRSFENSLLIVFVFLFFFIVEGVVLGIGRRGLGFFGQLGSLPFSSMQNLLLALVTAMVEETFFRGYLFNRLWEVFGKSWKTNMLVTLGFVLIHLPISLFVYQLAPGQILLSFSLLAIMSLGSGLLFSLTYNTVPSIIWHFLWNWQVILGV